MSVPSENPLEVTKILAQFIASATPELLSNEITARLKELFLDYLGVSISAADSWDSTDPIVNGILAFGATGGHCTAILRGRKFTPQFAGLLNATFGHSIDFDDTYAPGSLHPGVTSFAAGLAQAELCTEDEISPELFLLAVALGYEITCRLGRELGPEAYVRGFHNTSTAGIFGAVATIAVLKRLEAPTICNAFGLAVSKASGSMQYLDNGSWNKRLHPGFAVHDAFLCVALAQAGVLGATRSIEGKVGFLHAYSPKAEKDLAYLTSDLGSRWESMRTALKPFPSCRMTHGLIEIGGTLSSKDREREIERITVSLSPANVTVVGSRTPNKLHPDNIVDAQFSAYFQLAHAWVYGPVFSAQYYDRLKCKAIYELSEKIVCVPDPEVKAFGCKVEVQYVDGKTAEAQIPYPLGEVEHPFSHEQIQKKFSSLVVPVLGEVKAAELEAVVSTLEAHSISKVMAMLT